MPSWSFDGDAIKQFTLQLMDDSTRPIIRIENFHNVYAMLDTGALIPVWVDNEDHLKNIGGKIIAYNQPFGGFGGETKGTLYRLPLFHLGDLIFPELPIIASPMKISCHMILSATMFSGLIYEIDDYHNKFNVTIPEDKSYVRKLQVQDSNGKLHVFCSEK